MAIFDFSTRQADHAERAVLAAQDIQRRCRELRESLVRESPGLSGNDLSIGIGIDSGQASFGEFGRSHRDLTAIGTVVNTAARAQAVAEVGQILATQAVHERAGRQSRGGPGKEYRLKGFDHPVCLYQM